MGAGTALAAAPSKQLTARPAEGLPEQPVSVGGGARVNAGTILAAAPSKPVTVQPFEGLPERPMSVAEEGRPAAELPEHPINALGGARVGAGAAIAVGPSKPATARPAEGLQKQPMGVAEKERPAAELPEQPMHVVGGARVGAVTALAAAPSEPLTVRPFEDLPEQPMRVAEGE